jgi:hypothetical protein
MIHLRPRPRTALRRCAAVLLGAMRELPIPVN